jgi:NTE family protein
MASPRRAATRERIRSKPVPAPVSGPTFGLALGGGGARGFAHVLILEALDELGIRPKIIAGTSIGALIGAAAASGMSGAEIRAYCEELFHKRTEVLKRLFSRKNGALAALKTAGYGSAFSGENILKALLPASLPARFEELKIPFLAVTTDFYAQDQYVLTEGPLIPAIAASSALPGVLRPIEVEGRILVDGGFVNPVPFDLLIGRATTIAAIDVSAGPQQSGSRVPTLIETIIGSNQITLRSVTREKLKISAPDILIRPEVGRFRVLDFYKIDEIFAASEAAKDEFKRACEKILSKQHQL